MKLKGEKTIDWKEIIKKTNKVLFNWIMLCEGKFIKTSINLILNNKIKKNLFNYVFSHQTYNMYITRVWQLKTKKNIYTHTQSITPLPLSLLVYSYCKESREISLFSLSIPSSSYAVHSFRHSTQRLVMFTPLNLNM